MELQEVLRGRRSIRKFLAKPVSRKMIDNLIAEALWAPSWGNTQPWEIVAVTGKSSHPDIAMPQAWPDVYKARYSEFRQSIEGVSAFLEKRPPNWSYP